MTDKFKDIYRIESARLQNWNYGWRGAYFVTICTANREHYFGKIENNGIVLSEIGEIAHREWIKTPEIRPDMNIELNAFCVMPNHFHGIIMIGENEYNRRDGIHGVNDDHDNDVMDRTDAMCGTDAMHGRDAMHRVSTTVVSTIQTNAGTQNDFIPQRKNLASVIRGFKSAVTTYARKNKISFAWQARFHDHIIRNDESFYRIRQYIENNVVNWHEDTLFRE